MNFPLSDFFDPAVAYVIENEIGKRPKTEGGFTCDIDDRGGATKWGITIATLSTWRGHQCSVDDVKSLSRSEAETIYKAMYWQSISCHLLKRPQIATAMFDLAVLFGIGVSAMNAQIAAQAVGATTLKADGHIGPQTIEALNAVNVESWLRAFQSLFLVRISDIVKSYPNQIKYRDGWQDRVGRLSALA